MVFYEKLTFVYVLLAVIFAITAVESDLQANERSPTRHDGGSKECHYSKLAWSECNADTNTRSRVLSLKKGEDETKCEKMKTVEKKCKKKVCRYDKGTWSKCNSQNEITRTDVLRNPTRSDPSCEKSKLVTKKCKNKVDRPSKVQKRKHQKQQQQTNQTDQPK